MERIIFYPKKLFFLLVLFLGLITCQSKRDINNLPIPKDKLVKVISDAYLVEAAIQNYTQDIKDSLSDIYYQQLYEIHSITQDDFQNSLEIVKKYPEVLDSLYQNISNHLNELEDLK